jgi:MinD-like ATPase involved in chromosome partitioning or flagellar assembly
VKIVIAADAPHDEALASELRAEGAHVLAVVAARAPALAAADAMLGAEAELLARALSEADALILQVARESITAAVVAACDRAGVRIVPLAEDAGAARIAAIYGLPRTLAVDAPAWSIIEAVGDAPGGPAPTPQEVARIITVWGPAGAPGRTTIAAALAIELARGGGHVGLIDADSHAPSLALTVGVPDEGPGFAAACRQAELGLLDPRELARIAVPLGRTGVEVLAGLNRPSRWPELSDRRVTRTLAVCREWADHTVVDVAASLERDEEIVSDLDGPRRNAATLAALGASDLVVAVGAADPVGISRLLRALPELRATVGSTPILVLVNRMRSGALGIEARGQVRRTLDRFGGVDDVWFVPYDQRSADAALLSGRPLAEVAPKSPITLAVRRFVGEAVAPAPAPARGGRGIRRPKAA